MHRADYDYKKYGGKTCPKKNIFFGPITIQELRRCTEMAENAMKKRKLAKENQMKQISEDKENQNESELNRTFDVESENEQNQSFDRESLKRNEKSMSRSQTVKDNGIVIKENESSDAVSQSRLQDISNVHKKVVDHPKLFSHSPYHPRNKTKTTASDLNGTFDADNLKLEELISLNLTTMKEESVEANYAVPQPPRLKNRNERPVLFSQSPHFSPSRARATKCKSSHKKDCLIDDTFDESVKAGLMTPLLDKFSNPSRASPMKNSRLYAINAIRGNVESPRPVKLSDTFIAEVTMPEFPSSPSIDGNETNDDTLVKSQHTPDIFNEKHNDSWKKMSSSQTAEVNKSFKSKLPKMKKTPVKKERYLFTKSPVAEYIHRGIQVQSLSKPSRHSNCCQNSLQVRSKSDHKTIQPCKIPVASYAAAKRKLLLGETESRK